MSDVAPKDVLLKSGVKYRCACGAESQYQREAKIPAMWTLRWVVYDHRSWPMYLCPECRGAGKEHKTRAQSIEAWREQAKAKKKGKKR